MVKQSDLNEGFWTQLWNATLGHPRVQGALLAAGGIGEAALGAGLLLTPEPTGLTKIGGGALFLHGADLTAAGLKQFWMAQSVQTFTSQIVSQGLITTGVPSPYANLVGGLTEIGLAAVPIGIVGRVGQSEKALLAAAHGTTRAESSLAAQLLRQDLLRQEAASAFTASGKLSPGALARSFEVMNSDLLKNPNIPAGFSKWSTKTYQSPSGDFQVHFYRHPVTGEVHYGLDYKAKFTTPSQPLWPGPK